MSHHASFQIRPATWQVDRDALCAVRYPVFVDEQNVPTDIEIDEHDKTALHWLALDSQQKPIGTVRLSADGKVGRMAVLSAWRKHGVGGALLHTVLNYAQQQGYPALYLHSQVQAVPFYRRYGFIEEGEIFLQAGIWHQHMIFLAQTT